MADGSGLAIVVLAAGKGRRMKSTVPKVLNDLCGRPLISYVLDAVAPLGGQVIVVVAPDSEDVRSVAGDLLFAEQAEPQGTGHAVTVALRSLDPGFGTILVLPGDTPLITSDTLASLLRALPESGAAASMLTMEIEDPTGYGRVVRDGGKVKRVVEECDATEEERDVREVNACTYAFERASLEQALEGLGTDNAQGEYYLTGVVESLVTGGRAVEAVQCDAEEVLGINDHAQLAGVRAIMQARINDALMGDGVTMVDPATTYVDYSVSVGRDSVLMPSTILEGEVTIGDGCIVGPFTRVKDSSIGDGSTVEFSWLDGSVVAEDVTIGPFAKLRPGTRVESGAKIGSFVELKNTTVGKRSKVPHLSYVGDATIGEDVNVGAGTITCNYDGANKHPTVIDDGAFIGSDTMLIAPVRVGKDAMTGAGSSIYRDVPDGSLGIERSEQKNVPGYGAKKKKTRGPKSDTSGR
jgi:bifunctional UDP-N-acetylglucosamine pyrophosphorylase / glucosamine-1-phosphate N-acetyltransferase